MADVTFTVNGKTLVAPAGTLLIDACRKAGIEVPAFCYYPGLSLQAACRMCLVRIEKMPKLQTACTTTVAEGMIVSTETPDIVQARKGTLEILLGNHPLDCPVCDAGGECELQDMTFKYGAGESLYAEAKNHREEQQWSPAVFYDKPRCILCYRCVRMCDEGMDVSALAVLGRGSASAITPNGLDRLDCEQCGNCIDVCPVGALTSGSYRYKARPWEMSHVGTICAHCGDGCKVTLGVRQSSQGADILRADNRDKSGINNDFLCAKGRFGFDFVESADRLKTPLVRNAAGKLEPATWEQALHRAAEGLKGVRESEGANLIGVMGSNRTTNEENYLLQKLARTVLGTGNIDHERTADFPSFVVALTGQTGKTATIADLASAPAVLLVGGNPTDEHPLVAWQLRSNVRLNQGRLYIANTRAIKLERQARAALRLSEGYSKLAAELAAASTEFSQALAAEESLVMVIAADVASAAMNELVQWGLKRGNVRFACLGGYVNSRGAADMGLLPDLLPGYVPAAEPGVPVTAALNSGKLAALLNVGADPVGHGLIQPEALKGAFVVALDAFLTATSSLADVVLPAATLYEKSGTVTNSFGEVQLVKKAADVPGVKPDLEILLRLADALGTKVSDLVAFGRSGVTADLGQSRGAQSGESDRHMVWLAANGLQLKTSPFDPMAVLDEIERLVPGYKLDRLNLLTGSAVPTEPTSSQAAIASSPIQTAHDTLFTSGTLGQFSQGLSQLNLHQARKG